MRRLKSTDRLVVASHNAGKLQEISVLLAPFGIVAMPAGALGLPEPEETETTFAGNARLKALAAAKASGFPALADDSGLCVEALGGNPGIYSARWAGDNKDFAGAMAQINAMLLEKGCTTPEERRACFIASLCLSWPDGHTEIIEGRVDGTLVWPPRGLDGFGYDAMFQPDGESRTFGEMSAAEKQGGDKPLSHRARAFAALARHCLPEA